MAQEMEGRIVSMLAADRLKVWAIANENEVNRTDAPSVNFPTGFNSSAPTLRLDGA